MISCTTIAKLLSPNTQSWLASAPGADRLTIEDAALCCAGMPELEWRMFRWCYVHAPMPRGVSEDCDSDRAMLWAHLMMYAAGLKEEQGWRTKAGVLTGYVDVALKDVRGDYAARQDGGHSQRARDFGVAPNNWPRHRERYEQIFREAVALRSDAELHVRKAQGG